MMIRKLCLSFRLKRTQQHVELECREPYFFCSGGNYERDNFEA